MNSIGGVQPSTIQYLLFPLLVFVSWRVRIQGFAIPRSVIYGALAAGLAAAFHSYSYAGFNDRIPVALLQGDEHEVAGYKLRENLDRSFRRYGQLQSARFPELRKGYHHPSELLDRDRIASALAWGNSRWVNLALQSVPALALGQTRWGATEPTLAKLHLIRSVPVVGLSLEPRGQTAEFLAAVVTAYSAVAQHHYGPHHEAILTEAGELMAPWTSFSHRALPWWILGTMYLQEFLTAQKLEPALLECARSAFDRAKIILLPHDRYAANLFAAVHSNLAVLEAVESKLLWRSSNFSQARTLLRRALIVRNAPNIFRVKEQAVQLAAANLRHLKAVSKRSKKSSP